MALVNLWTDNMSSGARYQRVATYSVITRFFSDTEADKLRAMPKSPEDEVLWGNFGKKKI